MGTQHFIAGMVVGTLMSSAAFMAFRSKSPQFNVATTRSIAAPKDTIRPTVSLPARTSEKSAQPAAAQTDTTAPQTLIPAGSTSLPIASDPDVTRWKKINLLSRHIESPGEMEQMLETETPDSSWSAQTETQLQDYLARQINLRALGSTSVECRATICRVMSVVDNHVFESAPNSDLQTAIGRMRQESLWREFLEADMVMTVAGDPENPGRVYEVAYFRRAARANISGG